MYIYNWAIKSNEIMPFCSNMYEPKEYPTKWSKLNRERQYYVVSLIHGIWKIIQMNLYTTDRRRTYIEHTHNIHRPCTEHTTHIQRTYNIDIQQIDIETKLIITKVERKREG